VKIALSRLGGGPLEEILTRAALELGATDLSDTTRDYILAQLKIGPPRQQAARAVGMLLGAPEIQRR